MGVPVIRVDNLSKQFVIRKEKSLKERLVNFGRSQRFKEDFWALRGVSFDIDSGTTVGLVGPNGSGKSTLLKMVGGILQPTSGTVSVRGRIAALLELGAGFHPDLTGRENVYLNASILGISQEQTEQYFDAIVDFSGIEKFIDTQVKFYSSGMYVRLAFAVAVHVDPDLLLVDEVLAVGDEPFQRKCMDRIRQFQQEGRTILFVSHSLDQVAELCDRAIVLESGTIIADDIPRQSLRVLRSEFAQIRSDDLDRRHATATSSIPVVTTDPAQAPTPIARTTVDAVEVRDAAGNPVTAVGPLSDLTVDVFLTVPTCTDGLIVHCGFDSALGVNVITSSTRRLGLWLPPVEGRQRVTFTFTGLRLGEGTFSLFGAVFNAAREELDRKRDAASLQVNGDGAHLAFTWAPVSIAIAPMTDAGEPAGEAIELIANASEALPEPAGPTAIEPTTTEPADKYQATTEEQ
jgi:ABC-2 type transport system ATP-binding protein